MARRRPAEVSAVDPSPPAGPLAIRYVRLADAVFWDRNPKKNDIGGIMQSIRLHGFRDAPIYDATLGAIVAGNGRTEALREIAQQGPQPELDAAWPPEGVFVDPTGAWWLPMQFGVNARSREQAEAFGVDHNLLTATGGDLGPEALTSLFDHDLLAEVLQRAQEAGAAVVSLDADDLAALLRPPLPPVGSAQSREAASRSLAERFVVPPFSVLDARAGYWQERKRAWLGLGIVSELGRGAGLVSRGIQDRVHLILHTTYDAVIAFIERGRADGLNDEQIVERAEATTGARDAATSIFDPVLCEVVYSWFCPPGGSILDPFAGGSVRGIVASRLGRPYLGIELRPEQVEANDRQAAEICRPGDPAPRWIVGDAREVGRLVAEAGQEGGFDLLFTCPPYGSLERYSDDPNDLSTMPWAQFRAEYRRCILAGLELLKPDRFACIVTGDFRESSGGGFYHGFPEWTTAVLEEGGARKYNELILVTSVGSLPIRVSSQFEGSRKAGKTHQNVHVAVKGRPRAAAEACGPVEVDTSLDGDGPE